MEYIISKNFELPEDQWVMENSDWFNMWKNRQFPYYDLLRGDILYWFDTKKKKLVWKTKIVEVIQQPYYDKATIYNEYGNNNEQYYQNAPNKGYFLYYRVEALKKISISKPAEYGDFPRLGWEKIDTERARQWINSEPLVEHVLQTDDILFRESIINNLRKLDKKMKSDSSVKIRKYVSMLIRNDAPIIKMLKQAADYKCQYPNCGHQIKTRSGQFYIEVAHIESYSDNGKSILGNLLVLCPNHHKEFDYGDRKILEQSLDKLVGVLNGNPFEIKLIF